MADPFLAHLPRQSFLKKPMSSWLMIGLLCLYLAVSCVVFTLTVVPLYGASNLFAVTADSGAYFAAAGLEQESTGDPGTASSELVGIGGSVIGPVIVATIARTPLGVAVFNVALFLLSIQVAASIPGLSRKKFAVLMMLNALTLPALITLNKEILAVVGLAYFGKYIYSERRPWWLLGVVVLLSTLARWQQTAFIFVYLMMEWKHFPLRHRRKTSVAALLMAISVAWAIISWRFASILGAYQVLQEKIGEGGGTISRLNDIQGKGGFFLVVWPKMLMNISGRLVQIHYILYDWIDSDFHDLQNAVIGNLHSIALLLMLGVVIAKGRFRLGRPLIFFAFLYLILTSVSPLVQNRYEYPAYALLAMEMARKKESLEPVGPSWKLPILPVSYLAMPSEAK